jgi:hypothetical protein
MTFMPWSEVKVNISIPLNKNAHPAIFKWNQISLCIQTGNND